MLDESKCSTSSLSAYIPVWSLESSTMRVWICISSSHQLTRKQKKESGNVYRSWEAFPLSHIPSRYSEKAPSFSCGLYMCARERKVGEETVSIPSGQSRIYPDIKGTKEGSRCFLFRLSFFFRKQHSVYFSIPFTIQAGRGRMPVLPGCLPLPESGGFPEGNWIFFSVKRVKARRKEESRLHPYKIPIFKLHKKISGWEK